MSSSKYSFGTAIVFCSFRCFFTSAGLLSLKSLYGFSPKENISHIVMPRKNMILSQYTVRSCIYTKRPNIRLVAKLLFLWFSVPLLPAAQHNLWCCPEHGKLSVFSSILFVLTNNMWPELCQHWLLSLPIILTSRERPKSAIFALKWLLNKTFRAARSLWITFCSSK